MRNLLIASAVFFLPLVQAEEKITTINVVCNNASTSLDHAYLMHQMKQE